MGDGPVARAGWARWRRAGSVAGGGGARLRVRWVCVCARFRFWLRAWAGVLLGRRFLFVGGGSASARVLVCACLGLGGVRWVVVGLSLLPSLTLSSSLSKTLGVRALVVVINKMDDPTVMWEQERFDECVIVYVVQACPISAPLLRGASSSRVWWLRSLVGRYDGTTPDCVLMRHAVVTLPSVVVSRCVSKLKPFLKSCGYLIKKEVKFIPISALTGANLKDPVSPADCPWWEKSCAAVRGGRSHGRDAMRCNLMRCESHAMQCDAMRWQSNAMQCNAMRCNAIECDAMRCNMMCCNMMQCNAMQRDATRCNMTQCNAMQCTAMQCNTM